jgi:disulfide bond formation protein DsbB
MKGHLKHLAMCSPMLVIGVVLIIGGAGALGVILPVLGCVLMMGMMGRGMSHAGHHHSDRSGPREQ